MADEAAPGPHAAPVANDATAARPEEAGPREQGKRPPKPKNPWPFVGVIVLLCVAGWFVVQWMADTTRIQDCVMSGKKNCAPLDPKLGR